MGLCKQYKETVLAKQINKLWLQSTSISRRTHSEYIYFFLEVLEQQAWEPINQIRNIWLNIRKKTPAHWNMLLSSFYHATSDCKGLHWLQLPHGPFWPTVKMKHEIFSFSYFCTQHLARCSDVCTTILKWTVLTLCKYIHLLGLTDLYLMITVYFHFNIQTCCFGACWAPRRLDDAKLNYLIIKRDSGYGFQGLSV